jgi:hypothetical protein
MCSDVRAVRVASMRHDSQILLTVCIVPLQELTDEIATARVHASMQVAPVVTSATAPAVSVNIDAVQAALRAQTRV